MKDDEDKHAPAQVEGLATARPWRAKTYEGKAAVFGPVHPVDGGDYAPLAILHYSDPSKANAELIVTAVNSFDALVVAVRRALAIENSVTQGQERELREGYRELLTNALADVPEQPANSTKAKIEALTVALQNIEITSRNRVRDIEDAKDTYLEIGDMARAALALVESPKED